MIRSAVTGNSARLAAMFVCAALAAAAYAPAAVAGDTGPHIDSSFANPQPPYPDNAQINGEQGDVVLEVKVGDNGKIRQVHVATSSGFPELDNAAVQGVLNWHFLPAVRGGDTATEWTKVKITFQLPTAAGLPAHS